MVTEKRITVYKNYYFTDGGSPSQFATLREKVDLHLLAPTFVVKETPVELTEIDKRIVIHGLGPLKYFHALPPVFAMIKVIFFTYKLCKKYKYDLVIAKGPREIGMAGIYGAKLARIPSIYNHSLDWFYFPLLKKLCFKNAVINFYRRTILLYRHFFTLYLFKTADKVSTASDNSKKTLACRLNIKEKEITVMPNTFTTNKELLDVLPITMGIKNNIIYIGRIDRNKNLNLLLASVKLLLEDGLSDVKLFVVGDGPELGNCKNLVKDLAIVDNVEFLGYLQNRVICKYIRKALVLVLPSLTEVFPKVLIEAMTAARPVIASDVGGIKEIVENNVNGFLLDPYDEKKLASRIKELINNKESAKRMGLLGRQKAKEYSPEATINRWLSIMEDVVKNNKK
ncbi:MAG: glycosyltransferase [Spirochaetes bacterium]|nr:glycosyltransferase [Spirochaetota bacterium]